MKKLNLIIILFFQIMLFSSCGSLKEAEQVLRNDKIKTTDEFLIKKRKPLTQPPDFETIPEPGLKEKTKEENKVKKILKISENAKSKKHKSSSVEESILNQIKK